MSDERYYCAGDSCDETHFIENIPTGGIVTVKMLPNTRENRARLRAGYGYLVKFDDIDIDQEGIAAAVWNGEKFEYFDGRFIFRGEPQTTKQILTKSRVTGFARLVDWEA